MSGSKGEPETCARENSRFKAVVQALSQNKPLALLNCDCAKRSEQAAEALVRAKAFDYNFNGNAVGAWTKLILALYGDMHSDTRNTKC